MTPELFLLEHWQKAPLLMRGALKLPGATDGPAPFLNAQTHAIPFYRRHGFVPVGAVFMEAGIPHRRMEIPDNG